MDGYCKECKPADKDIRRDRGREIGYSKWYKCFLLLLCIIIIIIIITTTNETLEIGQFILMQKWPQRVYLGVCLQDGA